MPGKIKDLSGQRFERLTVTGGWERIGKRTWWEVTCDCGTIKKVLADSLHSGNTRSCGCLFMDQAKSRATKHGLIDHPVYYTWRAMRHRCNLETDPNYHSYGGRGIKVCDRWNGSFQEFWNDMGRQWRAGTSIERINNDGDYEPGNCKWATPLEQARNRRTARVINTPLGPMSVTDAAEAFGLKRNTITARLLYGFPDERLLEKPRARTRKRT